MKNHNIKLILLNACLLLLALGVNAKIVNAATVKFFYIAPTQTMTNAFGVANIRGGYADGYRGTEVTSGNIATFNTTASPKMKRTYNSLQPGQALRTAVDKVMTISGGKVDIRVFMADDRTGFTTNVNAFCEDTINSKTIAWPCAWVSPTTGGRYSGTITFGEASSNLFSSGTGSWLAWEGVVLHESSHTQFVGEKTKWGSIGITYGADGGHWRSELLGGQSLALDEGLGTFYGHVRNNPAGINGVNAFYANAGERYDLESWSVLAPNLYSVPHSERTTTPPTPGGRPPTLGGRYAVRSYKWLDLPGFYILYSESTAEAFFSYFWSNVNNNRNQAFDMIINTSKSMWLDRRKRFLTYAVNRLSLQLEQFATTQQGRTARTAGTLTSSMFPFALLDLVTHFGMSEQKYKQTYDRDYPDSNPRAYTQYWRHRNAVKTLVQADLQANPIRIQQAVRKIHQYFQRANTIL